MALLSKEAILSASDVTTETVPVPEWGGEVLVKVMTGTERDEWEAAIVESDGKVSRKNIRAKLVAQCIVDEQGNRLFTQDDVAALGKKSGSSLDRVYSVAARLNKLTGKDVDELAKNSGSAPSVDSGT